RSPSIFNSATTGKNHQRTRQLQARSESRLASPTPKISGREIPQAYNPVKLSATFNRRTSPSPYGLAAAPGRNMSKIDAVQPRRRRRARGDELFCSRLTPAEHDGTHHQSERARRTD